MPIFMDRHDVSETVTAENVAHLHKLDLEIQHNFNCRALTYWFDDKRKTAFCLVEAPNEKAVLEMHDNAHGEVPHTIIEVDPNLVESFLGRIEDPNNPEDSDLNIINDPAFRTIMVVRLTINTINLYSQQQILELLKSYNILLNDLLNRFEGRIAKQNEEYYLVSFKSVTNAVLGAVKLHSKFEELKNKSDSSDINLKIGLSTGIPVSEKKAFFEDSIKLAERLCYVNKNKIVVSAEVKKIFLSENINSLFDKEKIHTLSVQDEKFLNLLSDFIDKEWQNTQLKVDDFNTFLGMSESGLYRKMLSLTGKSPNNFIKEYRLNKALELLNLKMNNLSEIAYETGFNSLSYFSKCFLKRFLVLPSEYLQNRN